MFNRYIFCQSVRYTVTTLVFNLGSKSSCVFVIVIYCNCKKGKRKRERHGDTDTTVGCGDRGGSRTDRQTLR